MKHLVFIRGPESQFKRTVVDEIMKALNPDINSVRAIRVSIDDHMPHFWFAPDTQTVRRAMRAADKDCKNLTKKVLGGNHEEEFIVIDNESLLPVHWQSYNNLAEGVNADALMIGVDVYLENISTPEEERKSNLQDQNCAVFIASCYKYHRVKNIDELQGVIETFRK